MYIIKSGSLYWSGYGWNPSQRQALRLADRPDTRTVTQLLSRSQITADPTRVVSLKPRQLSPSVAGVSVDPSDPVLQ